MRRFVSTVAVFGFISMLSMSIALACSSEPEPTPTPTPIPTPVPLTPDEVISNAIDSLVEAGSLWFLLEHENGFTEALGGLELTRVEGAITESWMDITAEANLGRIYIEVDAIMIGNTTWLTNPLTGEWELLPNEENPVGFLQPIVAVREVLEGLTSAEFIEPPEPGVDYQLISPLKAEALKSLLGEIIPDGTGIAEVVIEHTTFKMKSARITGALQNRDSDSTVRIIEISRYGEAFVIEQPIP